MKAEYSELRNCGAEMGSRGAEMGSQGRDGVASKHLTFGLISWQTGEAACWQSLKSLGAILRGVNALVA